jgi:hypothetical protein
MYFLGKVKSYSTRHHLDQSLTCASETSGEKAQAGFERKMLRSIYGPIKANSGWRIRYSYELFALYEDVDIEMGWAFCSNSSCQTTRQKK